MSNLDHGEQDFSSFDHVQKSDGNFLNIRIYSGGNKSYLDI